MPQNLFSLHVSLLKATSACLGSGSSSSAAPKHTAVWGALMVCKDVLLAATSLSEAVAVAAGGEAAWLWLHLAGCVYCALADAMHALAQPAAPTEVSSDQSHAAEIQDVLPRLLGQVNHVLTKRINKMLAIVAVPGGAGNPDALASFNTGQAQVAVRAGPALRRLLEVNGGARSELSAMEVATSRAAQQGSQAAAPGAAVW
jgi:hypothetical protein